MNLSIVIPCRKELRLEETVRQIDATCQGKKPEIVIIYDGEPVPPRKPAYSGILKSFSTGKTRIGTGASRNLGVYSATQDHIFTCDAHMEFVKNDWARMIESELIADPKSVLCCRCAHITQETPTIPEASHIGNGGKIQWKRTIKDGDYKALDCRWHKNKPGEIGSVFGACYAFNKSWYIYNLCAPWAGAAGWGMDEESLSITNWLCGGTNKLIDVVVGHWFGPTVRYAPMWCGKDGVINLMANRFRMIDMLPLSVAERAELTDFVSASTAYIKHKDLIDRRLQQGMRTEELRRHLSAQKRNFSDYRKEWIIEQGEHHGH